MKVEYLWGFPHLPYFMMIVWRFPGQLISVPFGTQPAEGDSNVLFAEASGPPEAALTAISGIENGEKHLILLFLHLL